MSKEKKQLTGFEYLVKTFPALKDIDPQTAPLDIKVLLNQTPETYSEWTEDQRVMLREWITHELCG